MTQLSTLRWGAAEIQTTHFRGCLIAVFTIRVLKCNIESNASLREKSLSCSLKSQKIKRLMVKSHRSSAFIVRFSSDKPAHYQARTELCRVKVDCQERGMLSLVVETITELKRIKNIGLELIMNAYVPLSLLDVKVRSCLKMKQPSQFHNFSL